MVFWAAKFLFWPGGVGWGMMVVKAGSGGGEVGF